MTDRTDPTDTGGERGHLGIGTADHELLKTADLGDLETGISNLPCIVQERDE